MKLYWLYIALFSINLYSQDPSISQPTCENTPEIEQFFNYNLSRLSNKTITEKANLPCIPIYVETDKWTYDQFNQDSIAVANWIITLFEEVAKLYSSEGITIYLSDFYISTKPEWSDTIYSTRDILHKFAEIRKDSPKGRLKHFITTKPIGGGIAWVNILCSNYFFIDISPNERWHIGPYAVSAYLTKTIIPYPQYSWNIEVIAHEMGHNLGSKHTHACVWGPSNKAIDDCYPSEGTCDTLSPLEYGTIMSYCHLTSGIDFNNGFGTLPGNLIRSTIDNASCLVRDNLVLSGNLSGYYIGDTITIDNAICNDLYLEANCVNINECESYPIFEIINSKCNN